MKKQIYLFLTMILGVLLTTIIHAGLEIWYISLLNENWEEYSFGLAWPRLWQIHLGYTIILLILGVVLGYYLGKRWWRIIYGKKPSTCAFT